jgi:hypothetical protein
MPLYTILATKEVFYEVPIEAADEVEATNIFNEYTIDNDIERFEVDSPILEITTIVKENS